VARVWIITDQGSDCSHANRETRPALPSTNALASRSSSSQEPAGDRFTIEVGHRDRIALGGVTAPGCWVGITGTWALTAGTLSEQSPTA
jgi:hypothetical protein